MVRWNFSYEIDLSLVYYYVLPILGEDFKMRRDYLTRHSGIDLSVLPVLRDDARMKRYSDE